MERDIAIQRQVRREPGAAVDKRRNIEEARGSQEVAVSRFGGAQQRREQRRALIIEDVARDRRQLAEAVKLTALLREAYRLCDRFENRRLTTPVIAGQQCHRLAELQLLDRRDGRHAERKLVVPLQTLESEHVRAWPEPPRIPRLRHPITVATRRSPGAVAADVDTAGR